MNGGSPDDKGGIDNCGPPPQGTAVKAGFNGEAPGCIMVVMIGGLLGEVYWKDEGVPCST